MACWNETLTYHLDADRDSFPVRDVRFNAGGHHTQRVTLSSLPVVKNRSSMREVRASAGRPLRRLPTEERKRGKVEARREGMNQISVAIERLRLQSARCRKSSSDSPKLRASTGLPSNGGARRKSSATCSTRPRTITSAACGAIPSPSPVSLPVPQVSPQLASCRPAPPSCDR
jgi:hypothetical protein